mmetsp:Transcript_1258/g.1130  ORF Transcript_1258/g.1130 Transcript_1258/m.1130 type:complete len:109 (+) Transcript_1258:258-584(+)
MIENHLNLSGMGENKILQEDQRMNNTVKKHRNHPNENTNDSLRSVYHLEESISNQKGNNTSSMNFRIRKLNKKFDKHETVASVLTNEKRLKSVMRPEPKKYKIRRIMG